MTDNKCSASEGDICLNELEAQFGHRLRLFENDDINTVFNYVIDVIQEDVDIKNVDAKTVHLIAIPSYIGATICGFKSEEIAAYLTSKIPSDMTQWGSEAHEARDAMYDSKIAPYESDDHELDRDESISMHMYALFGMAIHAHEMDRMISQDVNTSVATIGRDISDRMVRAIVQDINHEMAELLAAALK
jgi:hypothetical protein